MVTHVEDTDVHPARFVTVNVQVPSVRPVTVVVVPEPLVDVAPGFRVRVQFPEGSPVKGTLPVATEQDGCVMVPVTGAAGVAGWAMMTTFTDGDTQPAEFVTVKL